MHDRQKTQPKPQRKRPKGVRTGEGARKAARLYRALAGWRDYCAFRDAALQQNGEDFGMLKKRNHGTQETAFSSMQSGFLLALLTLTWLYFSREALGMTAV